MPVVSRTSGPLRARRRNGACALAVLGALLVAFRASADVVELEELEAKAVAARGALTAARQRTASAVLEGDLARSAYLPVAALNVDGSGSPGGQLVHVRDESGAAYLVSGSRTVGQPEAFVPQARYGAVLSLQARLYDFGRTSSAVSAADAHAVATRAAENTTRASIVEQVRVAYLNWLQAVVLHSTTERAIANARARKEVVEGRIATGVRPASDLDAVLYDLALAGLDDTAASGRVENARLDLERATTVTLAPNAMPDASILERQPRPGNVEKPPTTALLEKQHAAAVAMARYHERETRPVLTAGAEGGIRGQAAEVFPAYRALLTLSLPLWDGGAAGFRAALARSEASALSAELREERANVTTEYGRARNDYRRAAMRLSIAERLLELATTRAHDAEARYYISDEKIEILLESAAAVARAEHEVLLAKIARVDAAMRLERPSAVLAGAR